MRCLVPFFFCCVCGWTALRVCLERGGVDNSPTNGVWGWGREWMRDVSLVIGG
jgi:hypothetical protein